MKTWLAFTIIWGYIFADKLIFYVRSMQTKVSKENVPTTIVIQNDFSNTQFNLMDILTGSCKVFKYSKGFVKFKAFLRNLTMLDYLHKFIVVRCNS